jgi:hypothetical protein
MVGYISWDQFVVNRDRLAKIVRSAPWRMRIDRARYEAELAERRYEALDPASRLIAATLEQRRNDALQRQWILRPNWPPSSVGPCGPSQPSRRNGFFSRRAIPAIVEVANNHAARPQTHFALTGA